MLKANYLFNHELFQSIMELALPLFIINKWYKKCQKDTSQHHRMTSNMQNNFVSESNIKKNSENVYFDKNNNTFSSYKPTCKIKSDLKIHSSKLKTLPFEFTQFKVIF